MYFLEELECARDGRKVGLAILVFANPLPRLHKSLLSVIFDLNQQVVVKLDKSLVQLSLILVTPELIGVTALSQTVVLFVANALTVLAKNLSQFTTERTVHGSN